MIVLNQPTPATDRGQRPSFLELSPEELLRPLNAVEKKNAPKKLYVAGAPEIFRLGPRVAVVGSRKASEEGLRRAARLTRALVSHGVVVISGLAEGIDAAAHETAMAEGGRTGAVLGSPVDVAFPTKNRDLHRRIVQHHVAVSQFPPGHPVLRTNFPQRNRTMALLSDATVIVEAGNGSGTLSQGWEALRLGRPLFLLKSVAENPALDWPREMIAYGAEILTEPEILLDTLPCETAALEILAF